MKIPQQRLIMLAPLHPISATANNSTQENLHVKANNMASFHLVVRTVRHAVFEIAPRRLSYMSKVDSPS